MHLKTLVTGPGTLPSREELLRGDTEVLLRYFLEEKIPGNGALVFEESENVWLQVAFRHGVVHRVVYSRDAQTNCWAEAPGFSREQLVPAIRDFCSGVDATLRAMLAFTDGRKARRFTQEEIERSFESIRPWWKFW